MVDRRSWSRQLWAEAISWTSNTNQMDTETCPHLVETCPHLVALWICLKVFPSASLGYLFPRGRFMGLCAALFQQSLSRYQSDASYMTSDLETGLQHNSPPQPQGLLVWRQQRVRSRALVPKILSRKEIHRENQLAISFGSSLTRAIADVGTMVSSGYGNVMGPPWYMRHLLHYHH